MQPLKPDQSILDYIQNYFEYDSLTGVLSRYSKKYKKYIACTSDHDTGRLRVIIKYKQYYVTNICWYLYHGEWPTSEIDHEDLDGYNNSINNLRLSSYSKNSSNADKRINNEYHGVTYHSIGNKWRYRFRIENKPYEKYGFKTAKDAAIAREKHLDELGDTFCARNKNLE